MKQLKQLSGKYTNSYILIQLLPSEPLEPRLENGKRLHYNFLFGKLNINADDIVKFQIQKTKLMKMYIYGNNLKYWNEQKHML